jgi:hypothetical protein
LYSLDKRGIPEICLPGKPKIAQVPGHPSASV